MNISRRTRWTWVACGLVSSLLFSAMGCQSDINGQTLPSAYYRYDDVQYFPPGSEFPLRAEAASIEAAKADMQQQQQGQ